MSSVAYVGLVWPRSTIYGKTQAQASAVQGMVQQGALSGMLVTECTEDVRGDEWARLGHSKPVRLKRTGRFRSFNNVLLAYPRMYREFRKEIVSTGIDVLYLRKPPVFDPVSIHFLRSLRRSGVRVVLEIPTYPYDREQSRFGIQGLLDRSARRFVRGSVDLIATFSSHASIFGVTTVAIDNAVDFDHLALSRAPIPSDAQPIRMVMVAALEPWHRVDRAIRGLFTAWDRDDHRVQSLDIVGGGALRTELEALVNSKVEWADRIRFHGPLFGEAVEPLFERANVGVGNLETASDRGLEEVRALKHREYAARGLPFIYGLNDPSFAESRYALMLNEEPIDMSRVADWVLGLDLSRVEIRGDAERFRWETQFEKVLTALGATG